MSEFIKVDGYQVWPEYEDHEVIDISDRAIPDINQVSVMGESHSQYIRFRANRYSDGIDLTEMRLQVTYELADGSGSECQVVNVKANDRFLSFGWVIPPQATRKSGRIRFSVWAAGETSAGKYLWKTIPLQYQIAEGLAIGKGITPPTDDWFVEFVRLMDEKIEEVMTLVGAAEQAVNDVQYLKDLLLSSGGNTAKVEVQISAPRDLPGIRVKCLRDGNTYNYRTIGAFTSSFMVPGWPEMAMLASVEDFPELEQLGDDFFTSIACHDNWGQQVFDQATQVCVNQDGMWVTCSQGGAVHGNGTRIGFNATVVIDEN